MSNLTAVQIIDKNGKRTTVHKNLVRPVKASATRAAAAPEPPRPASARPVEPVGLVLARRHLEAQEQAAASRRDSFGGYSGWSMSNRAVDAYDSGLVPVSKLTREAMKFYDIDEPAAFIRWYAERSGSSEWHHTGSKFRETAFYSPARLAVEMHEDDLDAVREAWRSEVEAERAASEAAKAQPPKQYRYEMTEWGGSRNRPTRIESSGICTLSPDGKWATLANGKRKRVDGNWFNLGAEVAAGEADQ